MMYIYIYLEYEYDELLAVGEYAVVQSRLYNIWYTLYIYTVCMYDVYIYIP